MKKFTITMFLFAFISIFTKAQEATRTYIPQVIPPSPESRVFERYLNHEIEECSGTPSINIPLYEIKIKGMTIPINLSYDASGIKHGQFDGTLGAGWSIQSMGYRVFREIHGRPDEKHPFYDEDKFAMALNNYDNPYYGYYFLTLAPNAEYLNILPNGRYEALDGEFDIFSYMLPSSNGNFIITDRENMGTAIVEKNGDRIVLNKIDGPFPYNKHLESMQITDKNGYIFELGGTDNSGKKLNDIVRIPVGIEAYNGWALKKITSPYGENVEFEYDIKDIVNRNSLPGGIIGIRVTDALEFIHSVYSSRTEYNLEEILDEPDAQKGFILKKIKTENETVEFHYDEDQSWRLPKLKTIIISNRQGKEIKRVRFNYSNSGGNKWHRMLESVEEGNGEEKMRNYNFTYYLPDAGINDILKVSPDQWGYYSQSHNQGSYFSPLSLHEEFRDYKYILENIFPYGTLDPFRRPKLLRTITGLNDCFFDRSKNYGLLHSFSLKRITFPTGGYTEYEYESHKFTSSNGAVTTGGGQRVKKIISKPEESSIPVITEFKYGENGSSTGFANFPWLDASYFMQESYIYSITESTYRESRAYMMSPVMPEFSKFKVLYKEISTFQIDISGQGNTKTISKYDIPEQYRYDGLTTLALPQLNKKPHYTYGYHAEVYDYSLGFKPNLKVREYYNNNMHIVRKEEYEYETSITENYEGVKVRQNVFFPYYHADETCTHGGSPPLDAFHYVKQVCNYTPYHVKTGVNNLLSSKKTTDYINGKIIEKEEKFSYDPYLQIKSTSLFNSGGLEKKEEYKYSYNMPEQIYKTMVNRNIIATVVEKNTIYNGKQIFIEKTHYTNWGSMILPSRIETRSHGIGNNRDEITFTAYDKRGNIQEYMTVDGTCTVILWGYNYLYPIAKIQNIRYNEVETYLTKYRIERLAGSIIPEDSDWDEVIIIDQLFTGAQVTLYTYDPLIGMLSTTDPSGTTTYYEYDTFGRLFRIRNNSRKIIEEYNYQYSNY